MSKYNNCVAEKLKGKSGLSKEERQQEFCVVSKLCSGKAKSEAEAKELCSKPKSCSPESMSDWVEGKTGKVCRPCALPVTISWYKDELEERGIKGLSMELDKIAETGDIQLVAIKLDEIKTQVSPELRSRLIDFDCATQSFKPSSK